MSASPYEVRCPRCEVSFPVETKTCMHCGGPTGAPGQILSENPVLSSTAPNRVEDFQMGGVAGSVEPTHAPIEPSEESPFSHGDAFDEDTYSEARKKRQSGAEAGGQVLAEEEEQTSTGRSLLNSLGGVIWVLLLIGFSLVRSCESG